MYVIPVFVWVLAFAIVFALQMIQPVVSLLTFAKGSLLLATVSLGVGEVVCQTRGVVEVVWQTRGICYRDKFLKVDGLYRCYC